MEGARLSVVLAPDPVRDGEIAALVDRVTRQTGHSALSEHKTMMLHDAYAPGAADSPREFVGALIASNGVPDAVLGYAPVVGDRRLRRYAVEVVVEPGSAEKADLYDLLVSGSVALVDELGGGTLRLWSFQASDADDARALAHGFRVERSLIQMRCPLPRPDTGHRPPAVTTRPFRPGLDEEAWLATNNRAFASHPEQGHWDMATLVEREKEPWFDPQGLLMLEEDGRLAGSCWTKVHRRSVPPMGEIYVIGVDPDFHGRGWGRALTEAGLDWLAGQDLSVGMLYVDADNGPAVSLYQSMGFTEHHVDRAYVAQIG
jgi:mycothiol synthase